MTLRRKSPLPRSGRVKPRNATRRNREWARAYGSAERVAFVRSLPCCALSIGCSGPIENAHVVNIGGGISRKSAAAAVAPLCARHHERLRGMGAETFQRRTGVDLRVCAEATDRAWQLRAAA